MKKLLDLRQCKTHEECLKALKGKKPDFILVDRAWIDRFCQGNSWELYRGIPMVVERYRTLAKLVNIRPEDMTYYY